MNSDIKLIPDFIFLGDYAKYIFLLQLLDEKYTYDFRNYSLWISYGNKFSVAKQNECYYITTYKVIPDTILFIPTTDYDLDKVKIDQNTRYAVFEEFPFIKEATKQILEKIESFNKAVVLVNSNKFIASTDLKKSGEDFEQAKEHYLSNNVKLFSVNDLNNRDEIEAIFYWRTSMKNYYLNEIDKQLAILKERIKDIKYDYELLVEDWNIDGCLVDKVQICSFDTIQKTRIVHIWQAYMVETYNRLFPQNKKGGLYDVIDLYREIMSENKLAIWNREKDEENLINVLIVKFRNTLEKPVKYSNDICSLNEETYYLKRIADSKSQLYGINVEFLRALDKYIGIDVCEEFERFLNRKCFFIDEVLSYNNFRNINNDKVQADSLSENMFSNFSQYLKEKFSKLKGWIK